jgi:Kef-type K+ transport system membrane component KefB/nucleotide-binding universal stress UspA family protein
MPIVVQVLIEVLVVIACSRLLGLVCRQFNQPLVIGEIIAGILLGPSFLGWLAPGLTDVLFPAETAPYLNVLSQVGLIFFMFLIGLELDPKYLKGQLEVAILTSHVSILTPFALGSILAVLLYPLVSYANVNFTAFALFLGAAMSITAFPVLARIITENNLQNTRLGTLALTCAAVDDVTAWGLLAVAIAVAQKGTMVAALPTILLSILYIGVMLTLGRSLLRRIAKHYERTGRLTQFLVAVIYMAVVISALITEVIGIHLIFGAFLLGAVMPKNAGLTRELAEKTEDFVLVFLLPVFFAYSGLRTEIGLLNRPELWLLCILVLAVAIVGKYVGTYIAARASGISNREASALGWLMNTRGLTELIVLNIGLSLNVISPLLFTMLVIMALTTTFMTSPLLEWTFPKRLIREDMLESEIISEIKPLYRVLVPVANPSSQKGLVQLAAHIAGRHLQPAIVQPLCLIELDEDYAFASVPAEADRLISQRRARLNELIQSLEPPEIRQLIHPIIQTSNNVARETATIAEIDRANLVLVGWHRSAFINNRLGGRVGQILNSVPVDVAVFVDRGQERLQKILVPYASNIHSELSLELALRLMFEDEQRSLSILRVTNDEQVVPEFSHEFLTLMDQLPESLQTRIELPVVTTPDPLQYVVDISNQYDLTLAGASREWGIERQTLGRYTDQLAMRCRSSLLITRRYSQLTSHLTEALAAIPEQETPSVT